MKWVLAEKQWTIVIKSLNKDLADLSMGLGPWNRITMLFVWLEEGKLRLQRGAEATEKAESWVESRAETWAVSSKTWWERDWLYLNPNPELGAV